MIGFLLGCTLGLVVGALAVHASATVDRWARVAYDWLRGLLVRPRE